MEHRDYQFAKGTKRTYCPYGGGPMFGKEIARPTHIQGAPWGIYAAIDTKSDDEIRDITQLEHAVRQAYAQGGKEAADRVRKQHRLDKAKRKAVAHAPQRQKGKTPRHGISIGKGHLSRPGARERFEEDLSEGIYSPLDRNAPYTEIEIARIVDRADRQVTPVLVRLFERLLERQTVDERRGRETKYLNLQGFTATDAPLAHALHDEIQECRRTQTPLSHESHAALAHLLSKYVVQLTDIANAGLERHGYSVRTNPVRKAKRNGPRPSRYRGEFLGAPKVQLDEFDRAQSIVDQQTEAFIRFKNNVLSDLRHKLIGTKHKAKIPVTPHRDQTVTITITRVDFGVGDYSDFLEVTYTWVDPVTKQVRQDVHAMW